MKEIYCTFCKSKITYEKYMELKNEIIISFKTDCIEKPIAILPCCDNCREILNYAKWGETNAKEKLTDYLKNMISLFELTK